MENLVTEPARLIDFYQGKRVFVTGHAGFKGGWISLWLKRLGAQVTGFSLPITTEPSLFTLARVGEGIANVWGDVQDLRTLLGALNDARPSVRISPGGAAVSAPVLCRSGGNICGQCNGDSEPVGGSSANTFGRSSRHHHQRQML